MLDFYSLHRGVRVIAVLSAVVMSAQVAESKSAPLIEQDTSAIAGPFGLGTKVLAEGPLTAKWRTVEHAIRGDLKIIESCRADRANCASPAAIQFLKIVDDAAAQTGLARVGEINRAFNLAIRPVSDQTQYGVDDLWTSPLATLAAGAGDCEDYAIAKFVALREVGLTSDNLRLVILRATSSGEDHAVVAARVDGRWRMLDNRYFLMLEDADVSKFQPVFAIDEDGAKRFEQPGVAVASLQGKSDIQRTVAAVDYPDADPITSAIDLQVAERVDNALWLVQPM